MSYLLAVGKLTVRRVYGDPHRAWVDAWKIAAIKIAFDTKTTATLAEACKYLDWLDTSRGTSLVEVFPEAKILYKS
jgi:hypothetical protein